MENNKKIDSLDVEKRDEPTSLVIIKTIGLITFIASLINQGLLIGIGVGLLIFVIITIIESTIYNEHHLVRYYMRGYLFAGIIVILGIITVIVIGVLFSRSLFQGFMALISVIILWLLVSKKI